MYDRTDSSTLKAVENYWIEEAKSNSDNETMMCLVGNKNDMPS